MIVTAWVMLEFVDNKPDAKGDPILMRGAKISVGLGSLDAVGRGTKERAYS